MPVPTKKRPPLEMEPGEGKAHEMSESSSEEVREGSEADEKQSSHSRKRSAKGSKNTKAPMDAEGGCCNEKKGKGKCPTCAAGGACRGDAALTPHEYLAACELGIQDRSRTYIRARLDAAERLDLKCGKGSISEGEKCTKGPTTKVDPRALAVGLTAGALAIGAVALTRGRRSSSSRVSPGASPTGTSTAPQPKLPPSPPPFGYLRAAPPRKSKTQRMRENTAAAVKHAEARIAQTAREETRRIAQVANTMGAAGEATGMAAKTTLRELRLRTEAARRRFEPGYRKPDQKRLPGGVQAQLPTSNPTPERVPIPIDPRTGQPRRRKARGFGRTDNYIQHYATTYIDPARKMG